MDPSLARKTWRSLEPLHAMIYFVPEAQAAYEAVGIRGSRMGYFASRAAAMGPVPAEVVIATFYNFAPSLVRRAIPAAWSLASPAAILSARLEAAGDALRRGLGDGVAASPEVAEAAALARQAAEAACQHPYGRPLFAAHGALEWPGEPLLDLWHAQTLLREFRGDGHVAALLVAGIGPLDALVLHEASGEIPEGFLRVSRAWSPEEWAEAVDDLRGRGLLEAGEASPRLSAEGSRLRAHLEDETDARALAPYEAIGDAGCARLRELGRPLSKAVVGSGLLTADVARLGAE